MQDKLFSNKKFLIDRLPKRGRVFAYKLLIKLGIIKQYGHFKIVVYNKDGTKSKAEGYNIITNAGVTDPGWSSTPSTYFHLPVDSDIMSETGNHGACFCNDDLNFLSSLASIKLNYGDTQPLYLTGDNYGTPGDTNYQVWNVEGRLTDAIVYLCILWAMIEEEKCQE